MRTTATIDPAAVIPIADGVIDAAASPSPAQAVIRPPVRTSGIRRRVLAPWTP